VIDLLITSAMSIRETIPSDVVRSLHETSRLRTSRDHQHHLLRPRSA
jgi:hypothetical protein